jgi:ribosomal protein S18 acetylase RimI-like enzyme
MHQSVTLRQAHSSAEIQLIAELARLIWNQHYRGIISRLQIDYMLAHFQSPTAIDRQIAEGVRYYLINSHGSEAIGYLALAADTVRGRLQISKIYVDAGHRGAGCGWQALRFSEQQALERGMRTLWLTVNKHNSVAISAYHRWGFHTADAVVADIGGGFVMDDYLMEKSIRPG